VLCYLVEHAGQLVSRDALMEAVWGHVVVTEGSLTQCLTDVRRALGDESQAVIRTVPRRGYLFDTTVRPLADDAPVPAHAPLSNGTAAARFERPADDPDASVPLRAAFIAAFVVLLVALSVTAWWRISLHRAATTPPAHATSGISSARLPRGAPPTNSIAVLPFNHMSADPEQTYFSDGISEEILSA
jgi:hypothetical protein